MTLDKLIATSADLAGDQTVISRAEAVRIYVTNSAGDTVHVVDPATNKVVQVFKGPEAMHGVAFAEDCAGEIVTARVKSLLR